MPDEFDKQVEDLLNDRLCTNCQRQPRDPRYVDWGMCATCGDQAAHEIAAYWDDCAAYETRPPAGLTLVVPRFPRWLQKLVWWVRQTDDAIVGEGASYLRGPLEYIITDDNEHWLDVWLGRRHLLRILRNREDNPRLPVHLYRQCLYTAPINF